MNLGRQLKRVKQQADHLFLRSDRTDVVGELRTAEEEADELRLLCDAYTRSLEKVLHTHTTSDEKKLRKIPEYQVAEVLKEGLNSLPPSDNHELLRSIVERVVEVQQALGMDVLDFEERVEKQVLNPLVQIIKEDFPSIAKQKKQLKQVGLDLDAAKTRMKNYQANPNQNTKIDVYREELEEAESKLDQARDTYACDIFSLLARHREVSQHVCYYLELQREFMQNTLMKLDHVLPDVKQQLEASTRSPVYGIPLHDHLRIVQKEIAVPIEVCVRRIIEVGLYEEGVFRVAGSNSKVRRLKGAFDANLVTSETLAMADDHDRDYDVHVVAGALKCYLRELPEPLLTHVLHDQWLEAVRQSDHQQRLKSLWMVVNQIPKANLANLRYLIKFLSKMAANANVNKMSPSNIAIVIAPNLIWAQRENDEQPDLSTLGRNMSLTSEYRSIVENLVEYCDYFFKDDVDFGVIPRVPPSPSQLHVAPNGTLPTPAQQRSGLQSHRRNASADFNRTDVSGSGVAATGTAGDCESPKQPQRTKKKQAPRPPQPRPLSAHGVSAVGQNAQDMQGVPAITTTSASASPEQIRSKTPPRDGGGHPSTPAPTSRLHHNNSIKRPTAEPPRPPSAAPAKPPRPSPPNLVNLDNQDRSSAMQAESDPEAKQVPLGFEQLHATKDLDSSDDGEVFLRKNSEGDGAGPIGFVVDSEPPKEDQSNSPKSSRSFRQSLENVLQLQAAGQPVALPRHGSTSVSTHPEGDGATQPVLPLPRTASTGDSARPVVPPTPAQRTTIPASTATPTLPRTVKETNQTSAVDRAEPVRVDKPALPEKPSIMNRSTVLVDHSKPQVPEKPSVVTHRLPGVGSGTHASNSDVISGANEQELHGPLVLPEANENQENSGRCDKNPEKLQSSVAQMNAGNAGDGSTVKSGGAGKFSWPPSTDTAASTPSEEEAAPDSTNL